MARHTDSWGSGDGSRRTTGRRWADIADEDPAEWGLVGGEETLAPPSPLPPPPSGGGGGGGGGGRRQDVRGSLGSTRRGGGGPSPHSGPSRRGGSGRGALMRSSSQGNADWRRLAQEQRSFEVPNSSERGGEAWVRAAQMGVGAAAIPARAPAHEPRSGGTRQDSRKGVPQDPRCHGTTSQAPRWSGGGRRNSSDNWKQQAAADRKARFESYGEMARRFMESTGGGGSGEYERGSSREDCEKPSPGSGGGGDARDLLPRSLSPPAPGPRGSGDVRENVPHFVASPPLDPRRIHDVGAGMTVELVESPGHDDPGHDDPPKTRSDKEHKKAQNLPTRTSIHGHDVGAGYTVDLATPPPEREEEEGEGEEEEEMGGGGGGGGGRGRGKRRRGRWRGGSGRQGNGRGGGRGGRGGERVVRSGRGSGLTITAKCQP